MYYAIGDRRKGLEGIRIIAGESAQEAYRLFVLGAGSEPWLILTSHEFTMGEIRADKERKRRIK